MSVLFRGLGTVAVIGGALLGPTVTAAADPPPNCTSADLAERPAEAIPALKKYLALNPRDADALVSLGASRRLMRDLAAAADTLAEAGRLAPESPRLHFELGNLMLDVRTFADAQACFERAIQYAPGIARYHSHLGLALEEQGRIRVIDQTDLFRDGEGGSGGMRECEAYWDIYHQNSASQRRLTDLLLPQLEETLYTAGGAPAPPPAR